jgi:hypothetical protein
MKKVLLLSVIALAFVGCNPGKESKRTAGLRNANVSATGNVNLTPTYCGNNMSSIGTIYDQGSGQSLSGGTFENRVKGLLSVTVDPSEVGQISSAPNDQTGVRFEGQIKLDSNGQINLAQSNILIVVYDSFTLQGMDPIDIRFTSAAAGQFNSNGSGYVVFRDEYGEVRFDGNLSGDYFSGQVSYVNNTNVTGGSAASGVLGQFYVARCGIFK